jgi:hypothetical protein
VTRQRKKSSTAAKFRKTRKMKIPPSCHDYEQPNSREQYVTTSRHYY